MALIGAKSPLFKQFYTLTRHKYLKALKALKLTNIKVCGLVFGADWFLVRIGVWC
jgi:hypothetical protein